ncbi:hypothetical protein AVEN_215849-1 [Araneus ventricosus]|uniref:Glucose-methanol-choline oxidoreductase C-terminal domain-containing protein n=1 Tax=Araneus ventricosus TaxID=182803 RepID=A0A4Y2MRT8_ARAVE|nr:hypothetical protein AVEN_238885-1 [Araneus ventricosus]GBN29093.1 hypothetical protein AVEN_215849-1 [Araneus ventricosus]
MQKVGAKPFETVFPGCERFLGDVDSYFTCVARSFVISSSHPVGTSKMGDPRDPTTVVDPLLRESFGGHPVSTLQMMASSMGFNIFIACRHGDHVVRIINQ